MYFKFALQQSTKLKQETKSDFNAVQTEWQPLCLNRDCVLIPDFWMWEFKNVFITTFRFNCLEILKAYEKSVLGMTGLLYWVGA
jgi:hypothetical protein